MPTAGGNPAPSEAPHHKQDTMLDSLDKAAEPVRKRARTKIVATVGPACDSTDALLDFGRGGR